MFRRQGLLELFLAANRKSQLFYREGEDWGYYYFCYYYTKQLRGF